MASARSYGDVRNEIARGMREAADVVERNLRRHGRFRPDGVRCNLGRVLDLSASGVRIGRLRPLRGDQVVELSHGEHRIAVRAKIKWITKRGFASYELGIEFSELSAAQRDAIHQMGIFG